MKERKIYQYEVYTNDENVVEHIVSGYAHERLHHNAYRYNGNCWVRQDGLKFKTLRNGVYNGTIAIF